MPNAPGTEILVLCCASARAIRIGRGLASATTPSVPSAHWHIDYLRRYTRLEFVRFASGARREHEWVAKVATTPGRWWCCGMREATEMVRGVRSTRLG